MSKVGKTLTELLRAQAAPYVVWVIGLASCLYLILRLLSH